MNIRGRWATQQVWIGEKEVLPDWSLQVRNHSPTGFSWGHNGIGSAQLALALLLDLTTAEMAVHWYQDVQWHVIAKLPRADFVVDVQVIADVIGLAMGATRAGGERQPVTETTAVEVDYQYTREELQALFDVAYGEDVTRDGRYDARSGALTIYTQPWTTEGLSAESTRMGSFAAVWGQGNRLWQLELEAGFSLEDLLEELGSLEQKALGRKMHGQ
jgi:hypothetical protein